MLIKAVIFDMDGLMLDTEPLYRAAAKKAAAEFGYELSDSLHERLIGRNVEDAERIVREAFGPEFPLDEYKKRSHSLEGEFKAGPLPKKPGLDELLDLLDSWCVPKAVATSTRSAISLPNYPGQSCSAAFRLSLPETKWRVASPHQICSCSRRKGSASNRRAAWC